MEPIASTAAASPLRPQAAALATELGTILRQGRVIAAEVLESSPGSVLLAIGRQRVPAETEVRLAPGQHLLLQVEEGTDGLLLRILGEDPSDASDLLRALRGVVAEDEPLGELMTQLARALRAGPGEPGPELARLDAALAGNAFDPEEGAAGLLRLLSQAPARYEASLAAALGAPLAAAGLTATLLGRLRSNLKGTLLEALERLEKGPLRQAVERMLAAIESEQLLNVARRSAGDALVWSLPVPDGEGWTTARFVFRPRSRNGERGSDGQEGSEPERLVVGVRFSRLGPIQAELALDGERIHARVLVTRSDLVGRIQRDFEELARRMGRGERSVHLLVRVVAEREVEAGAGRLDIRFLRDHRLMDVAG